MHTLRQGFTLFELLVVIAIIAILGAALLPAYSSATDRARITECRAHLTTIAIALRMYREDHGGYPATLEDLLRGAYITDDSILRCTKTGATYYYARPTPNADPDRVICACVSPDTPKGKRPHGFRNSLIRLQAGGKITEVGG